MSKKLHELSANDEIVQPSDVQPAVGITGTQIAVIAGKPIIAPYGTSTISTFAELKNALTAIASKSVTPAAKVTEARASLVGQEIADTWAKTDGTEYANPWIVTDVHFWRGEGDAAGTATRLGALLQRKYVHSENASIYGNDTDKVAYWVTSAMRQWLNSSAPLGTSWFTPTEYCIVPPTMATTIRGYVAGCSSEVRQYAKKVYIKTLLSPAVEGGSATVPNESLDLFFSPSGSEMYLNTGSTGSTGSRVAVEGEFSPYWKGATGYDTPNDSANAGRIVVREDTSVASVVALRTMYNHATANKNVTISISTAGASAGISAGQYAQNCQIAPCCVVY